MNIFDLLFSYTGPAMQLTFQYGFLFKEEDFLELTDEQYLQFRAKMGECDEKIFLVAPADPQNAVEVDSAELPVVIESQKEGFLEATRLIEKYCEGKNFHTDEEKLRFAAQQVPDVFSKGTKYEKYAKFSIAQHLKDEEMNEDI